MRTILTITNQKGGVGKTTTALNLASALEAEHKRVLLIDNDPQGNLTASMGFTPAEQKYTLANLLLAAIDYPEDLELHLPRCILHTDSKPDLIPANRRLSDAAARLQVMQLSQYSAANDSGRCAEQMLAQVLAPLREDYDYIIIDCGLKQELLTVNALSASDSCIIPVQSHFLASEGIPDVLDTAKHLRAVPRRSVKSAAHNGKKNRRVSRRRRKHRRRNPPVSKNSGPSSVTPLRRRYCSQKPFLNGLNFTNRRLPESHPPMQAIWILTESTLPKPLETCRSTRSRRTPYRTTIKESRKTAVVWMDAKAGCPQRPFRTSICC